MGEIIEMVKLKSKIRVELGELALQWIADHKIASDDFRGYVLSRLGRNKKYITELKSILEE